MYSSTDTLVDDLSLYYDNTNLDTVVDITRRRNKIMSYIKRAYDEIWWWRPWPWTMYNGVLTMSNGMVNAPTDFAQVGPLGGMYEQSTGRPWVEINYQDMITLRNRSVRVNDKLFAIGPRPDSGARGVLIPNTGSSQSFNFVYRKTPPSLSYGSALAPLPYHFGHPLLLGTVARLKEEEGDPRPIWRDDFMQALSRAFMTERETGSRPFQMPMAVGRKW